MTRGSGTNEQQSTTDRTQGKVMDKWKLTGSGALIALSALAAAVAYHHPIAVRVAVPGPFATDRLSDEAQVALGDGRTLTLGGGVLTLGDKHIALTTPRHFASLTAMPTGQVLIWGGVDNEGRLVETGEWFEPSTGALVTTGRLGLPVRAAHTLSVLSDGSLAMTGGWGPGNVPAHEVAVWRPLDRSLSVEPGDTAHARLGGEAVLLADGTLKVTGGIDDVGRPVHDAWQFGTPERHDAGTPGIAASYPLKDARSASPIGPLALRFDEPIDAAQLNGTVSLLGPNGVVKTRVVGAENGRLAFIQLPDELYPSARYTIFVQGLHTAGGKPVPYEAIGFTTRAARNGVVLAGEGKRPGTDAAKPTEPAVYVMAGEGKAKPCKPGDAFHLCRDKGEVKDGAFYPGQDNVATASGGHWRLYKDRQSLPDTKQLEANLPKGATALIGQVRRIDETPVANVAITIGEQTVQTDAHGVFVLQNLQSGRRELFVDGGPAGKPGTEYGRFIVGADVTAATVNHMPFVMYLPRVLERDKIPLPSPTTRETVLTHPDMPGLELRIPAGAVFKDRNGKVLNEIAIVPTPVDHAPFPLPDNFPMYFTIQPGDAVVQGMTPEAAKGIQVVYPNYGKQKPADKADFWVYSAEKGWEMYGAGHVSSDASQLVADKDTRLVWALGAGASTNSDQPDNDKPTCGAKDGDPVDLQTGIFYENNLDLSLKDTVPIGVDRSINGLYSPSSPFGLGTGSSLTMTISSDNLSNPKVVLSCGEPIKFDLAAGSAVWPLVGTVWRHTSSDSSFYGATLQFLNDSTPEGAHWVLSTTDGHQYWFDRHAPNKLYLQKDRNGNTTRYEYTSGLLTRIISTNGKALEIGYNSQNLISHAADETGRSVQYAYHALDVPSGTTAGWVLDRVTYWDGSHEDYTYVKNASSGALAETWLVESIRDRRGNLKVRNTYDPSSNRVTKQTYADDSTMTFAYENDATGHISSVVVERRDGSRVRYEFDPTSRYTSKVITGYGSSSEETTNYQRDRSGLVNEVIDSLGRKTSYKYDGNGNKISEIKLSGSASPNVTEFEYNGDNDLVLTRDPMGHQTKFTYADGCQVKKEDAQGAVWKSECDTSGRVVTVTDPLGNMRERQFRGGDLVAEIAAKGGVTAMTYDYAGRVTSRTLPDGSVTQLEYSGDDLVIRAVDRQNEATAYAYDGNGNVTEVTLPNGGKITYAYDPMNRLTSMTDPVGKVEEWAYDKMGRVASHRLRDGSETTFSYDELGRLRLKGFSDGSGIQASYDGASRLTELLDSESGSISWAYDELDRPISEDSVRGHLSYSYDASGRRISLSVNSQAPIEFGYDEVDRLQRVAQKGRVVKLSYDSSGRKVETVFPNGVTGSTTYDQDGNAVGIVYKKTDGTVIQSRSYSFDMAGRKIVQTDDVPSVLLSKPYDASSIFDKANRPVEFGGFGVKSDENGSLTDDGKSKYEWNARGQLTSISLPTGERIDYRYDALGRRTERRAASVTSYLYDGQNPVVESTDGQEKTFLNGDRLDHRYAALAATGELDFLVDELGTVVATTDESQSLVSRYAYDAFGLPATSDEQNRFQFTGREWEGEGLYYFRARYYSAEMGRFISEDPMRFDGGGPNFFSYVGNAPTMYSDPTGLCPEGGDWWPFGKKKSEPTGEIDPTKGPKCPLPMPNDPLKPIPVPGGGMMGCHAAMLEKIVKCSKKCPGVLDRTACIEEWRIREPACVADHAGE